MGHRHHQLRLRLPCIPLGSSKLFPAFVRGMGSVPASRGYGVHRTRQDRGVKDGMLGLVSRMAAVRAQPMHFAKEAHNSIEGTNILRRLPELVCSAPSQYALPLWNNFLLIRYTRR